MTTTYSIIPLIKLNQIPILNVKDQTITLLDIRNLYPRGEPIDLVDDGTPFINQVRAMIRELVFDAIEKGKHGQGLNELLELDESPPRFIDIDVDPSDWLSPPALEGKYFISKVDYGSYDVDFRRNRAVSDLNFQRVFLSAPPRITYNNCEFFKPAEPLLKTTYKGKEIEASCAFQYFYQTYGAKSNYSKYCGTTRKSDPVEKMKSWVNKDPPQFEEWLSLYKSHKFIDVIDKKKLKPIPDWVDIETEMKRMPELELVDFKDPVYTKEQEWNSLTLMDIVKLCMWMRLNLVMFDDLNQYYLAYYDKQFQTPDMKKRPKNGGVAVRIVDNHAYFVKNGKDTQSAIAKGMCFDGINDGLKKGLSKKQKEKAQEAKNWSDAEWIQHPAVQLRDGEIRIDWGYYLEGSTGELTQKDFEDIKMIELEYHYKTNPPPMAKDLIRWSCCEALRPTIYWTGNSSLNGLVQQLAIYHKLKPDNMRGLAHTIKRATYGSLMIMAKDQYPKSKYPRDLDRSCLDSISDEKICLERWKKYSPELEELAIPSAMKIANAIFDKNYEKRDYLSMMNDQVRKIFYDAEIKADFRKTNSPTNTCFSLDFSKAYSNAMKLMDCEWGVYDAIDQPKRFRQFREDAFYLCKETRQGYPRKNVKGLVLYHGCLLRHLLGKGVIPVYILTANKSLPKDYFAKFVDECYELINKDRHDDDSDFVNGKQLVNTFIGELKKRDGIHDYKLWINNDSRMAMKNLLNGLCVSNLSTKTQGSYRNSMYLSAKAQSKYNFMTGQPIRLQIMDRINEMNLLLDSAYKASLWMYNKLNHRELKHKMALIKTDAIYYEYPIKVDHYLDTNLHNTGINSETRDKFDPQLWVDLINQFVPDGYEARVEREIIRAETIADYETQETQHSAILRANRWDTETDIKKKWTIPQAKPLLKSAIIAGGGLFEGEAGTGKSECIDCLDNWTQENRKKYRWVKLIKKLLTPENYYEECENWRNENPVFIEKFAPTNKATNRIGGKTFHKGLGIPFSLEVDDNDSDDEEEEEIKPVDFMEKIVARLEGDGKTKPRCDLFVADEISMINGELWSVLTYLKLRIPTMTFLLFGDIPHQLPPVKEEHRNFNFARCIKEITNFNKITLHYNFRRNGDANELWDDWSLHPERFKPNQNDKLTERNLSFTNATRKKVIDKIQDRISHPLVLECENEKDYNSVRGQTKQLKIGLSTPLIARRSHKDYGFAKNEILRVVKYNDTEITFENELVLSHNDVMKFFLSAYCITIHKSQGDTYKDQYTIHDWSKIRGQNIFERKLRYVAQSRSNNPVENVKYKY